MTEHRPHIAEWSFRTVMILLSLASITAACFSIYYARDSRNIGLQNLTIQQSADRPTFALARAILENPFDETPQLVLQWTNVSGRIEEQTLIVVATADLKSGKTKPLSQVAALNPVARDAQQTARLPIKRVDMMGTIVVCAFYGDSDNRVYQNHFYFKQPTKEEKDGQVPQQVGSHDLLSLPFDDYEKVVSLRVCEQLPRAAAANR